MTRKISPSEGKAQEIAQWLPGQRAGNDGQELVSALVRLSPERVLQEALGHEQAAPLGRDRYARPEATCGSRHGYDAGTVKTAAGGLGCRCPKCGGSAHPSARRCGAFSATA
jgi:hypothetical protein